MNYKLRLYFCRTYLFILFIHIVNKSYINTITTDEAYTFLEYVYTSDIFNIGIANNHVLNTFAMAITTSFGNSEIFLRLPNVIAGLGYLLIVGFICAKSQYKIYTSLVLTSPIYLIEYFTLARGYGISAFLIFFGCVNYYSIKKYKYNFLVSTLAFFFASLSIHIYLIFATIFVLINAKKEFFRDKINFLITLLVSLFFGYYITIWTFLISQPGRPLFGAEKLSFETLIKTIFGLTELFQGKNFIFSIPIYLLFIFPIFTISKTPKNIKEFYIVTILTLVSFFVLPIFFDTPFPVQRVLIPLLPSFLLINIFTFEETFKEKSSLLSLFSILFSITLAFNLILNIDNRSTIDWGDSLNKKELMCDPDALNDMRVRMAEYYKLINKNNLSAICN